MSGSCVEVRRGAQVLCMQERFGTGTYLYLPHYCVLSASCRNRTLFSFSFFFYRTLFFSLGRVAARLRRGARVLCMQERCGARMCLYFSHYCFIRACTLSLRLLHYPNSCVLSWQGRAARLRPGARVVCMQGRCLARMCLYFSHYCFIRACTLSLRLLHYPNSCVLSCQGRAARLRRGVRVLCMHERFGTGTCPHLSHYCFIRCLS